jgi:gluconate 2-dehydrogenase gamma chain
MQKRRAFLVLSIAAAGDRLVYSLDRRWSRFALQPRTVKVPLRFFTEAEARIVAASAARIFPADDAGPGANEAGVVIYIDRQLAGPYGRDRYRYTAGPFETGLPEQGYQGKETPREVYREGCALLKGFDELPPGSQDARLEQIEKTRFFQLLRQHTIEGMFCDPMHGGNAGLIGWQMLGFPGPYMSWSEEIGKHAGEAFRPKPKSLSQILERPVTPWEDSEK